MPLARRAASVVAMVKPTETCNRGCPGCNHMRMCIVTCCHAHARAHVTCACACACHVTDATPGIAVEL